jgi:hypothetical protein
MKKKGFVVLLAGRKEGKGKGKREIKGLVESLPFCSI